MTYWVVGLFTNPGSLSKLPGSGERPWEEHPGRRARPADASIHWSTAGAFPTAPSCDGDCRRHARPQQRNVSNSSSRALNYDSDNGSSSPPKQNLNRFPVASSQRTQLRKCR